MTILLSDPHHIRADLQMIERAIKNKYPISDEIKAKIVEMSLELLESQDDRVRLGAIRSILAADSINVRREALEQQDDHHVENITIDERRNRIVARLVALREGRGDSGDRDTAEPSGITGPITVDDEAD
jgi:hypothetical protein